MIQNFIIYCFKDILEIKTFSVTHHCDDLKVFKVSPLCSKNFLGDKIGLVSWITLKKKQCKFQNWAMENPTTINGIYSNGNLAY